MCSAHLGIQAFRAPVASAMSQGVIGAASEHHLSESRHLVSTSLPHPHQDMKASLQGPAATVAVRFNGSHSNRLEMLLCCPR